MERSTTIIWVACATLVTALFSIDLFSPALPAMEHDLGISQSMTKFMVVMTFIAIGMSQLFWGPLSERFGRRPIMLAGLVILGVGNLVSVMVSGPMTFLFARFICGIGAGACLITPRTLIVDTFKEKELLTATYAIVAMAAQVSPAVAPFIGGFTQHLTNWRMDFMFLAVLSFVMFGLAYLTRIETLTTRKAFCLSRIKEGYTETLRSRNLWYYSSYSGVTFAFLLSFIMLVPFVLQHHYGLSPMVNGVFYIVMPVGIMLGSYAMRRMGKRGVRTEVLCFLATILLIALSVMLYLMSTSLDYVATLLIFCLLASFAIGLVAPIQTSLSLFGLKDVGSAAGIQSMIKMSVAALVCMILFHIHIDTLKSFAEVFIALSFFLVYYAVKDGRKLFIPAQKSTA